MNSDPNFNAVQHNETHQQLVSRLHGAMHAAAAAEALMAHRANNSKAVHSLRVSIGEAAAQRLADRLQHDSALARTLLETLSGTELGRLISQYHHHIGAYGPTITAA